jgi:hypothetical protein
VRAGASVALGLSLATALASGSHAPDVLVGAASFGLVHQAGELTQVKRTVLDIGIAGAWRRDF